MNLHKTRKSILCWECFLTSRTTMSDWPKGSCSLFHFLWGYFFYLKVSCFKLSGAIRDDFCHCQSDSHCIVLLVDVLILISPSSSPFISHADLWESVFWSYLCHGFSLECLWYLRFLNSCATHLCHTFAIIIFLFDITMINFFLNLGLQITCDLPISRWNKLFGAKFTRT